MPAARCECCEEGIGVARVTICDLKDVVLENFYLCLDCLEFGAFEHVVAPGTLKHLGKEEV